MSDPADQEGADEGTETVGASAGAEATGTGTGTPDAGARVDTEHATNKRLSSKRTSGDGLLNIASLRGL
jgi:hypothetical protein